MLYHRTWFPELIPFCSDKISADYKHSCFSGVPWRSTSLATWGHHKSKQDLLLCGEGEYKHLSNDTHNCVTCLATTSQRLPDTCSQGNSVKGGGAETRQLLGSWFLPWQNLHSFLVLKILFTSAHMWHYPFWSSILWLQKVWAMSFATEEMHEL